MTDQSSTGRVEKDTSYSPASESETAEHQDDRSVPEDIDATRVRTAPGTGGPDDAGDIDIEGAPIYLPGREPADDTE